MVAYKQGRFSSYYLPEELTEQIIARVSCGKSLLRCTSVCRSWYALIHSANLIKLHLSLIPYVNTNLLLCEFRGNNELSYFRTTSKVSKGLYHLRHDQHRNNAVQGRPNYFAIHYDSEGFKEYRKLLFPRYNLLQVHACNGLICYNTFDDPRCLYLWNPTTATEKRISTPLPNLNNGTGHHDVAFSLWFDKSVNDYKILGITYSTAKTCTVEVYSLSSNSWRLISDDAPGTVAGLSSNSIAYVNGTFYWPVLREEYIDYERFYEWFLISLDMENETFQERSTNCGTVSDLYLIHSHHDDCLVMFGYQHVHQPGHSHYHLSVFEVHGHSLNVSYTNSYDTFLQPQPMGFRNNGDLLVRNFCHYFNIDLIRSYHIKTAELKNFASIISGALRHAIPFVETIALLDDADAIKIKPSPQS